MSVDPLRVFTDAKVAELQEEWNPDQYNDWDEPAKGMMKDVAKVFYNMTVDEYREVLLNTDHDV